MLSCLGITFAVVQEHLWDKKLLIGPKGRGTERPTNTDIIILQTCCHSIYELRSVYIHFYRIRDGGGAGRPPPPPHCWGQFSPSKIIGGGGGGRPAPPLSLILQKCLYSLCIVYTVIMTTKSAFYNETCSFQTILHSFIIFAKLTLQGGYFHIRKSGAAWPQNLPS